jgi:hypothetical protein
MELGARTLNQRNIRVLYRVRELLVIGTRGGEGFATIAYPIVIEAI